MSGWCIPGPDSRAVVGQDGRTTYPGAGRAAAQSAGPYGGVNPAFSAGSTVGGSSGSLPGLTERPGQGWEGNSANGGPGTTPVYGAPTPSEVYGGSLLLRNRRWNPIGQGSEWNYSGHGPISPEDLPPTLRYPLPSDVIRYTPMNPRASAAIARKTEMFMEAVEACVFVDRRYPIPPTIAQPKNGRVFQEMNSISFAGITPDINTVIYSFQVPYGCDGMLNRVVTSLIGATGFVNGSGDVRWRVQIGNTYARNLGDVRFIYGSLENSPFIIPGNGIKLVSGQTVKAIAFVPTGSPVGGAGARVAMGLFGYFWPRK